MVDHVDGSHSVRRRDRSGVGGSMLPSGPTVAPVLVVFTGRFSVLLVGTVFGAVKADAAAPRLSFWMPCLFIRTHGRKVAIFFAGVARLVLGWTRSTSLVDRSPTLLTFVLWFLIPLDGGCPSRGSLTRLADKSLEIQLGVLILVGLFDNIFEGGVFEVQ